MSEMDSYYTHFIDEENQGPENCNNVIKGKKEVLWNDMVLVHTLTRCSVSHGLPPDWIPPLFS
jgi:hypothetical protein